MTPSFAPVLPSPAILVDGRFQKPNDNFARLERLWKAVSDQGFDDGLAGRPRKTLTGERAYFQRDYDGAYEEALESLQGLDDDV